MTLVLSAISRETIWMVADRRLSTVTGRLVREDARKMMFLETTDGIAILGYAGLGTTASGTEPVDWMSAVLRGRNLPLERSLAFIADAAKRQLPKHLARMGGLQGPQHHILIPAFVGTEARYYWIGLAFANDRKTYRYEWTRIMPNGRLAPPPLAIGGSGAGHLDRQRMWMRPLLRLLSAHDRGVLSTRAVADHLAAISFEVHQKIGTVGPRSIVAWRHRKPGKFRGGGGHQFYNGLVRDSSSADVPTIARGMDLSALVRAALPFMLANLEAHRNNQADAEFPSDEVNAALARLPHGPDEQLR